jgi:hypothetical protein
MVMNYIKHLMVLFVMPLIFFSQSGWAGRVQQTFVKINSSPNDVVCVATKNAIDNIERDQAGSLYGLLRSQKTKSPYNLAVGEVEFYSFETKSFAVMQNKKLEQRTSSYYTLDVANNGIVRTVELVAGGYRDIGEGGGDVLWVYRSSWAHALPPIDKNTLTDVVLEIGYRTVTFFKEDYDFSFKYYIYPFRFKGRNFLLVESNIGSPRKYIVVVVAEDFNISTRCNF